MKKKNKQLRNLLVCIAVILAVVSVLGSVVLIDAKVNSRPAEDITTEEAQEIVEEALAKLPTATASSTRLLLEKTEIEVNKITKGEDRELILSCTYTTVDLYGVVSKNIDDLMNIDLNDANNRPKNATRIQIELKNKLNALIESAEKKSGNIDVYVYETINNGFQVHLSDEFVNTVLGGIIDTHKLINSKREITVDGRVTDISRENTLRRGCIAGMGLSNYSQEKPDTSTWVGRTWNEFKDEFYKNFIFDSRWKFIVNGLGTTLAITALALVLGVIIGIVVAVIRCTYAKIGKLKILDKLCGIYLAIMRGTPVMVQLMIIYFVVLLPIYAGLLARLKVNIDLYTAASAVICFGINSGAYVAEIIRGGIMSVDDGQTEAGRSLGLGYVSTMWYIVVPQAFKAILPALANEFITLLKETSVAFYIGVADLTQGGLIIRSLTYSDFMPLIAIALIYLILVLGLSYLVSLLERRLRKSDRS